jgi:hypothetical protein
LSLLFSAEDFRKPPPANFLLITKIEDQFNPYYMPMDLKVEAEAEAVEEANQDHN